MNDGDYTQAIKTARLRSMRLMLLNAREEYKFAKLSCEYGFSVAQTTFGGGSDVDLMEDQKKRLESAKKRDVSGTEVGSMNSYLRNIKCFVLRKLKYRPRARVGRTTWIFSRFFSPTC